ncbi:hypothetical protein AB4Z32_08185 [Massilia sp. 2TAF26]|uniref:hypothetical protein n=1 Tax=Massilia sp. 2TAF26 TaxID=3233012 RepID=UPI003F98CE9A
MRLTVKICLLLASAASAGQGLAGAPEPAFDPAQAVDPAALDDLRGGFEMPGGLIVSLGIERIVTINGNVAQRSQLNLGDLGTLTSGMSRVSAETAGQVNLIQNGVGTANLQLGKDVLGATFIQNNLNNQLINSQTIINASVDARGLLQTMNFQSTLANALNTAVTGR